MDDMKSLLTVTLVVMAAGSSIYTIKTFMKPGMDLNINLEENHNLNSLQALSSPNGRSLAEALIALNQTSPISIELPSITELPFVDIENNTISEVLFIQNKSDPKDVNNNNITTNSSAERRRSLLLHDESKLNEIVEKIKKFEKKNLNKSQIDVEKKKIDGKSDSTKREIKDSEEDKKSKGENIIKLEAEVKKEHEVDAFARTMLGKIQGTRFDVLGRTVNAFLGIPYAQPPLESLRFSRPFPVTSWKETFNATKFGSACIQHVNKNLTSNQKFSEDCLNLNVWTPAKRKGELPVMFYIHGGNFVSGSNSADESDGRALAALHNVIVVSPNYRLGPLGFFSVDEKSSFPNLTASQTKNKLSKSVLESEESQEFSENFSEKDGNYGLWDLVEALKWTRANIASFGGKPESITLIGQSSGALAAALLSLSPQSSHLSNRAILQSGSPTVFNFYYQQSQRSSEEYATLLGCMKATESITKNNFKTIFDCVKTKPKEEILKTSEKQLSQKLYAYSPRIGDELLPFLPQEMLEKLQNSSHNKQFLIGTNSNDVPFFFKMGYPNLFTKKTPTLKDLEEVRQFLAASLKDWGISRRTLRLINSFFLERSTTLEPRTLMKAMHDIFGDLTFSCPSIYFTDRIAALSSNNSTSLLTKVFFYQFNRNTTTKDETFFSFGHPLRYANDYSGSDIDLSKTIMQIWSNFARFGNPGSIGSTSGKWLPYNVDDQWFLNISSEMNISQHPASNMTHNSGGSAHKLNCDTWKHAFKVFN